MNRAGFLGAVVVACAAPLSWSAAGPEEPTTRNLAGPEIRYHDGEVFMRVGERGAEWVRIGGPLTIRPAKDVAWRKRAAS